MHIPLVHILLDFCCLCLPLGILDCMESSLAVYSCIQIFSSQLRGAYQKLGMLPVFDCSFSETQALLWLLMPFHHAGLPIFCWWSLHLMSHWGTFLWIVKITPIFRGSEVSHNQSFIEIACNNEYLWFGYNAVALSKRHERESICLYICFSLKCCSKFFFISTGLFTKVAIFL